MSVLMTCLGCTVDTKEMIWYECVDDLFRVYCGYKRDDLV